MGLDIYTSVKDVPVVLTSHANDFVDNVYNLTAFVDAVQTDMFNLLKLTGTKIAQTRDGVNKLIDQGEKKPHAASCVLACLHQVRGRVLTASVTLKPSCATLRKTVSTGLLDVWQTNRNLTVKERKSPVLQAAVKNAGAIHSVDVIINFNL